MRFYFRSLIVLIFGLAAFLAGCSLSQRATPTSTLDLTEVYGTLVARLTTQPPAATSPTRPASTPSPTASTLTPPQPSVTRQELSASSTARPTQPIPCDQAAPGSPIDVTIPDNTQMEPGAAFTKIWRLVNSGSCTWTVEYGAAFFYGDRMDAPATVPFSQPVPPGASVEIAVEMIAPLTPGAYQGNWKLSNADEVLFGIGPNGDAPFWVRIIVAETLPGTASPTPTVTPASTPTPTLVPSPTATPLVLVSGTVTLLPLDALDLDTLKTEVDGADLEYQTDASNFHWLTPQAEALLGAYGSLPPGLAGCQSASMSLAPIAVESLSVGSYLCYRTGEGAYGQARLEALTGDTFALTLDLITWVQP